MGHIRMGNSLETLVASTLSANGTYTPSPNGGTTRSTTRGASGPRTSRERHAVWEMCVVNHAREANVPAAGFLPWACLQTFPACHFAAFLTNRVRNRASPIFELAFDAVPGDKPMCKFAFLTLV